MPVRVYDISKKLGLENKEILAVAKSLGIAAAKVPSSSLDKITGEYLEEECKKRYGLSPQPVGKESAAMVQLPAPTPIALVAAPPASAPSGLTSRSPVEPKPATLSPSRDTANRGEFEKPSKIFERRVRQLIDQQHPFCALSNILLFHAERAQFGFETANDGVRNDYAFEIDHLLHRATETKDVLTVIECKNQPLVIRDEQTWEVFYTGQQISGGRARASNVQKQLEKQARALRGYVNPLSRSRRLLIEAIVVSSDPSTVWKRREVNPWLTLFMMSEKTFAQVLTMMKPTPQRVVQSDLLGLLRLGMPVPELGHPELANAIAYIERCRRDLDAELFRAFDPTRERWAINGSAGMGKSVLLAYSLFVLTTDRRIHVGPDNKELVDFSATATDLGLSPLGQRGVFAFALKEKQRQVIEVLFRRFVEEFAPLAKGTEIGIRRPAIRLWTGRIPSDCHVLVLDEAHDLSAAHAQVIADWINAPEHKRYLLIACDRHQKLRLVGRDENIINGVSFSLKTKKLRLNYRNPFAVYSASLGLMFRWFAKEGPKVLPTRDDLQNGFGFSTEIDEKSEALTLSVRNDAHPANSWSDCVSIFPSCEAALARLQPGRFRPQDVLWVRFDDEDEHFDYEQLSCFTYHNLNSPESIELTDKYIKGQDFPIVVIEGFSEDMNAWNSPDSEQRMWQRRKELYVCSSRATAFLFMIPRASTEGGKKMCEEVQEIVRQLSTPSRDQDGFNRTWRFSIMATPERRRMDVFTDAQET